MKNPFSKCGKIRRRLKKHNLTTKCASNFGAFQWDESVFGESYTKKHSNDDYNETTAQRQNTSRGELLSIKTKREEWFNSRTEFISSVDLDVSSKSEKEFTSEVREKIMFLLNILYADEFVDDAFLLEFMIILFANKKSPKELQEVNENICDQDMNACGPQEWIDIMSEKIYGSKTPSFIARQRRIPGPVGRPVIGGSTMHKMNSPEITIVNTHKI